MKLSELNNKDLFDYMLVYNDFTNDNKSKINFIVYKNHLMYLKEHNTEKYNYYNKLLSNILTEKIFPLKKDCYVKIGSIDDLLTLFNSCIKKEETFFEDSLLLNNTLIYNGLCPLILYAFNNTIFECPMDKKNLKELIEFSIIYLYRIITEKKDCSDSIINKYTLLNENGAVSNIYLNKNKIIKYPKTIASKLFLMRQEIDTYNYLSKTDLNEFIAKNYTFNPYKKIITHDFVEGENGEFYLFNHITFTKNQISSLKEFYMIYTTLDKKVILDIHPGNFIWNKDKQKWIIIDLGILPTIGKEYYEFSTFDEYFEKIWIKREETIKRIPIRSIDLNLDLDVKDKEVKYE